MISFDTAGFARRTAVDVQQADAFDLDKAFRFVVRMWSQPATLTGSRIITFNGYLPLGDGATYPVSPSTHF